jgi:hypothetical protein
VVPDAFACAIARVSTLRAAGDPSTAAMIGISASYLFPAVMMA